MKYRSLFLPVFFKLVIVCNLYPAEINTYSSDNVSLRGYLKAMQGVSVNREFTGSRFNHLLHNRLNFRWNVDANFIFYIEGRNRVLYDQLFGEMPVLGEMFEQDEERFDLSWVWLNDGSWVGHTEIDRLYFNFRHNNWQFSAGRQRINWGINMVSNPNDLFNTYSFFDFDYPERPGADAVRVQYHTGFASRIEAAYAPARSARESVGALLWAVNLHGYDLQSIAGFFRNRTALGFGWAGSIGGAGFKGETTWFYSLENTPDAGRSDVVAAIGLDYMMPFGTFAVFELLYNGGYQPLDDPLFLLSQPLRPDNIMFSQYAGTLQLQHPFSPVFDASIALMGLPDKEAAFIMPGANISLLTNFDLNFLAQIFLGGKGTIFEQAGSAWYMALKYSF